MRSPRPHFNLEDLPELSCSFELVAGVDEVGRGCLFGPVVAAAVILPKSAVKELLPAGVRDSKKLSRSRREQLAIQIKEAALDWQIGAASNDEIDNINIFHASLLAMKRAVLSLKVQPQLCLVDGKWKMSDMPFEQQTIVKGDEKSLVIAAASIIAKVWRDELVMGLEALYPEYELAKNKGYGTAQHLLALQQHGPTPLHRRSFAPCQGIFRF